MAVAMMLMKAMKMKLLLYSGERSSTAAVATVVLSFVGQQHKRRQQASGVVRRHGGPAPVFIAPFDICLLRFIYLHHWLLMPGLCFPRHQLEL